MILLALDLWPSRVIFNSNPLNGTSMKLVLTLRNRYRKVQESPLSGILLEEPQVWRELPLEETDGTWLPQLHQSKVAWAVMQAPLQGSVRQEVASEVKHQHRADGLSLLPWEWCLKLLPQVRLVDLERLLWATRHLKALDGTKSQAKRPLDQDSCKLQSKVIIPCWLP